MLALTRNRHRSSDENSGDPHVGPAAPAAQRAGAAHSWDIKVPIFAKRSPRRTRKAAPFRQELHSGDTLLNLTKKTNTATGAYPGDALVHPAAPVTPRSGISHRWNTQDSTGRRPCAGAPTTVTWTSPEERGGTTLL